MFKQEWEMRERHVVKDVVCNKCGQSCGAEDDEDVFLFVELKEQWGYHSTHDFEWHRSHLCAKCYDELIASFVVPVEVKEYHFGEQWDPFAPHVEEHFRRLKKEREAQGLDW